MELKFSITLSNNSIYLIKFHNNNSLLLLCIIANHCKCLYFFFFFIISDGTTQLLAGCLRDFRNKPFPTRARIEYYQNTLTVCEEYLYSIF